MTTPSSPPFALRVALLHNYRDSQQSMRLYAARLGEALLRRGVSVTRVKPPAIVPETWRARSALALSDQRLRGVLVERGLARAAQFSWQRTAAQVVDVYGDVAAKAA